LLTGRLRLVTRDETVSSSDEIRTTAVREGGAISFPRSSESGGYS
jgi:hypothetical protein